MLAVVGFLVGEKVEGSSFLFDASIKGPAITHLAQVPAPFWILLTIAIGASEYKRAEVGWVEPENVPVGKAGLLRDEYYPGDIGFDPLGLKPSDNAEFNEIITKELQVEHHCVNIYLISMLNLPFFPFRMAALPCLLLLGSWPKNSLMERESLSTFNPRKYFERI